MPNCSFCGSKENKATPLCQSCGSLRYPVTSNKSSITTSRQEKLKLSAVMAVAAVTPGAFIVLAMIGVSRLNTKARKL